MDPWRPAAKVEELPPDSVREVVVEGAVLVLVNHAGNISCMDGICAHQGGPLGRGKLEAGPQGCRLTCPWHGWQYDVATGKQVLSTTIAQCTYDVRIEGGTIWVSMEARRAAPP